MDMMKKILTKIFVQYSVIVAMILLAGCGSSGNTVPRPTPTSRPASTTTPVPVSKPTAATDPADPLHLSFSDGNYYEDAGLREKLSHSVLEYCSSAEYIGKKYVITWNLKDSGEEVYRCEYTYDNKTKSGKNAVAVCHKGEAYDDFRSGNAALTRYYVMPEPGDRIDMFVYPDSDGYYKKYFILGKYSDMNCYISGEDIYFEYSWYQDTENGPVLVYRSTAKNYDTTSGQRYHEELWDLFEQSRSNIHIIPYNKYPREKDYYDVWRKWDRQESSRIEEGNLEENKKIFCACEDEEDLYDQYGDDFDSYYDALDFWERYCQ